MYVSGKVGKSAAVARLEFNLVTNRAPARALRGTCRSGGMVANLPASDPCNREVGSPRTQLSFSVQAASEGDQFAAGQSSKMFWCALVASAWIPRVGRLDGFYRARSRATGRKGLQLVQTSSKSIADNRLQAREPLRRPLCEGGFIAA